jgi:hypothetical protein
MGVPPKKRRSRRGEPPPDVGALVVRGDVLDPADLRAEALNWALLRNAVEPEAIVEGAIVVAGTERFWSWARIRHVDEDGQVHFEQLMAEEAAKLVPRAS